MKTKKEPLRDRAEYMRHYRAAVKAAKKAKQRALILAAIERRKAEQNGGAPGA